MTNWLEPAAPWAGVVVLPDGSRIRGRSLRSSRPEQAPGEPAPDFGLYLGVDYAPSWDHRHIEWPDFWLPRRPRQAARLIAITHERARAGQRVEVACGGGRGRTGTVIACVAILAGVDPEEAVRWTRTHYDRRAVETPWQRRWVRNYSRLLATAGR